jgi:1-deoxy-D-xylulose-5-phosphate synthase
LDKGILRELSLDHDLFVTMEENVRRGGFGEQVLDVVNAEKLPVQVEIAAIPDTYIHHASPERQRENCGLDAKSITERILDCLDMGEAAGH